MKKHGYTVLGGFCMALADSVPSVSGGTIALLMGYYDVFVGSLDALVHGTKQERLCGLRYLLKLAADWAGGMALATMSASCKVVSTGACSRASSILPASCQAKGSSP